GSEPPPKRASEARRVGWVFCPRRPPYVARDMRVVLLGTAAGGGFPQWNCWCPTCRVGRTSPARARPRTQSSIAVSADGERWFLCNASPDVREQLRWLIP